MVSVRVRVGCAVTGMYSENVQSIQNKHIEYYLRYTALTVS